MNRRALARTTNPPRPLATVLPVLIATLALPAIERFLPPGADAVEPGERSREILVAETPLESEASATEVFDWLRSIERIAFERPMELTLDIDSSDSVTTRLRATVVAAPGPDLVEENR